MRGTVVMARLVKLKDTFYSPVLGDIKLLLPPDVSSPPPEVCLGSFGSMCAYCGVTNVELLQCGRCHLARCVVAEVATMPRQLCHGSACVGLTFKTRLPPTSLPP